MIYSRAALILGCLVVFGCSSVNIETYQENSPELDVEKFFNGTLQASGIVKNRKGKVIRHFNAAIEAAWSDGVGTLDEKFEFSDGEIQTRIWTLTRKSSKTYIAQANDVIGKSTLRTAGNALFLKYVLQVPYKNKIINLKVDDRMYLVNESTLLNESIMTKFGFEVASITLVIRKL